MPDAHKFLEGFELVPQTKFGGFILTKATSTHESVKQWHEYKYNIVLTFRNLGRGSYSNLYHAVMDEIETPRVIYGIANPYRCTIDPPKDGEIIDDAGTIIFHLVGHAHRIYHSQL